MAERKVERRTKRDEAWVANYPPLAEWLVKVEGRCLWQQRSGTSMIEGWAIGGAVAIVEVYANGNGWNIYTACQSKRIDMTLIDAELRTGFQKKDDECTVKPNDSRKTEG
jgi:hypothetical protein